MSLSSPGRMDKKDRKKPPLVSVVFVNYNGKDLLKTALSSLKKSTFRDFETLVVDNASTDGSKEMLRESFPRAKIIANKANLGYTGINSAIPHCSGDYILFLNNDLEMHPESIGKLLEALQKDSTAALSIPKLVNYYDRKIDSAGTWVSRSFYNGHYRADKVEDSIKEIPYMGVGLLRKDIIEKFGYLFDPDYFIYAEDLDLGIRIRLLGLRTLYVPSSICYHMHSQTMKSVPDAKKTFLLERNLLTTFYKTLSWPSILLLSPYVYGMRMVIIIRDVFAGKFSVALARIKAVFSIFSNFPRILKKRRHVQRLRKAGDAYVLSAFSEKHLFSNKRLTI